MRMLLGLSAVTCLALVGCAEAPMNTPAPPQPAASTQTMPANDPPADAGGTATTSDAGAAGTTLPPGMLITLVENAIKHGIELSPNGGRVDVRAERGIGNLLVLTVSDTGAGLDGGSQPGQGIGLANIRERLELLFGEAARLELEGNEPRGFVARIRLPVLVDEDVVA